MTYPARADSPTQPPNSRASTVLDDAVQSHPRFSVVIPTYNVGAMIGETIDSLAKQTYRDFEVVLVDDGSTDNTVDIARAGLQNRGLTGGIVHRPSQARKGASSCRNIGMAVARGDWIAFLDGDDLFRVEKLARMHEAITVFGDVVQAFYHRSSRFADRSREHLGEVSGGKTPLQPRWILNELLEGNYHATCGMVVSRNLILEIGGFHSALNGVEDWWFVLQVARRTQWVFVDDVLADIRVRDRSLMHNQPFSHYVRQHIALLKVASDSHDLTNDQVRTLRRYVMGPLTRYFAGQGYAHGGWNELAVGLGKLAKGGYVDVACRLAYRQARASILSRAIRTLRA